MITLNDGTKIERLPADAETAAKVISISRSICLCSYEHPLPSLTSIGGNADLRGYAHPLPNLASVGGGADMGDYPYPLPNLASIGGPAYLYNYMNALPALASIGRAAYLQGYPHPLPNLASVGGCADLRDYPHPLPNLTSISGFISLEGYQFASWPWLIAAGKDARGYYFCGVKTTDGWRVRAGRDDFSIQDARDHWGAGGESDKPDCLALVEKIAAEAALRDAAP